MTARRALGYRSGLSPEAAVSDPPPAASGLDFEQALTELEAIVERMEQGDLPLEESLAQFERGITLARDCQHALRQAEQRVERLVQRDGEEQTEPFEDGD